MNSNPSRRSRRGALGFVQYNGQWMTLDESYRARGYVKHDGQWMTPNEAQMAQQAANANQARDDAERRANLAEADKILAESRADKAEERARADADAQHSADIATNASDIATNSADIETNTSAIEAEEQAVDPELRIETGEVAPLSVELAGQKRGAERPVLERAREVGVEVGRLVEARRDHGVAGDGLEVIERPLLIGGPAVRDSRHDDGLVSLDVAQQVLS